MKEPGRNKLNSYKEMTTLERPKPIGIQLERADVPFHISSRKGATEAARYPERISISELEKEKYKKILELLSHPELESAIADGHFTLGIIKAQANQGRGLPESDEEAANALLQEVRLRGVNVVFAVNLHLTRKEAEIFYAEHSKQPWFGDLINFTISGPKTYLLIQDRSGEATQKWRDEIGTTHAPEGERVLGHPERPTLRALYRDPNNSSNNVFHGSDSPESAAREISILRDYIESIYQRIDGDKPNFPSEEEVFSSGLLPEDARMISIEKIGRKRKDHLVRYKDPKKGVQETVYQRR
jgi:nucleoside-diphosphate kinase